MPHYLCPANLKSLVFLGKLGLCSQNGRLKTYSFPVRWQIWHPPLFWTCLFMISSISAISACFIMFPHVSSYFIIFHPFIFVELLRSSTNTTCGWSPNLKTFLRSSVRCFSVQLLEDLGDDLLGFSIRFCQTCSPPTSKKFPCIVFRHLGDFWNFCSRSFGLSKLRKTMSTLRDSPKNQLWGMWLLQSWHLQAWSLAIFRPISGGDDFFFLPQKKAAKKTTKTLSENTTTLVSTYVLGVSFPTIHLRLRLPAFLSSMGGSRPSVLGQAQNGPKMWIHFAHGALGCRDRWVMLKRPSFWMIMCGILIYPMFFKIRFMQICGNNHTSVLEKRVCQWFSFVWYGFGILCCFFAWLGVLFHFYLIMTESVSVFHVSLRWIYPPPSNSGK